MTSTITLTGDYGYEAYKVSNLNSVEIDASRASWTVANVGDTINLYPFSVRDSADVTMTGGTIDGEVPLDTDWRETYVNSAAVYARNVDNVVIQDWIISRAWDAIRVRGDEDDVFTIDNVWISDVRDDAVENDDGLSGTISNSLFDGVFVGISLGDSGTSDQTDNLVTVDNVLIRMSSYPYKGEVTHQSPFKVIEGVSPSLSIHDTVIAIEDVDHEGQGRLGIAWDSVVSSSGNYFLNLSDEPLPDDYPMPPEGFTILQGQEARDYWDSARDEWIADFLGEEDPTDVDDGEDPGDATDGEDPGDGVSDGEEPPPSDDVTDPETEVDGETGGDDAEPDPSDDEDPPPEDPVGEDQADGGSDGDPGTEAPEDPEPDDGEEEGPKHDPKPRGPKDEADGRSSDAGNDDGPDNFISRFFEMLFSIFRRSGSSDDDGDTDVTTTPLKTGRERDTDDSDRDPVEYLTKIVPVTGRYDDMDDQIDPEEDEDDQMRAVVGF